MAVIDDCSRSAVAPESQKTRRARLKLEQQFAQEKEFFTPEALGKTVRAIHDWIADNAPERVRVQKEGIHLFNRNQDAAKLSKKVETLAQRLKIDMGHFSSAFDPNKRLS